MKLRAILLGMLVLAGCVEEPSTGPELYAEYCASCHGADAKGGALGDVVAPDLTTLSKRNDGIYPASHVMSTIDGYLREETHGPMPVFGELLDYEIQTWTDENGVPTPTPVSLILLSEYLKGLQVEG